MSFIVFSVLGSIVLCLPLVILLNGAVGLLVTGAGFYDESTDWVLPHNIPPHEGGLSFRWVMAADTLHERYERHGVAWYEARNAALRPVVAAGLAALEAAPGTRPSDELLGAMDNLSVGLDYAHDPAAAIDVQRRKAALLPLLAPVATPAPQPIAGDDRWYYTTWANLGTHLVHANAAAALQGDADAIAAVEEGRVCIDRAVAINPGAHFGRELWQAVAIRYILKGIRKPEVFTTWDLIGNRYDAELPTETRGVVPGLGAKGFPPFMQVRQFTATSMKYHDYYPDSVRDYITRVGAEEGWPIRGYSTEEPVAFDEPMLGIIGMWQFGGGPNPWFAITIGNTMERVGQPYIAWDAFARALSMRERWPADPAIRTPLVAHCEARQAAIEAAVTEDHAELQRRFDAELAIGTAYQANRDAYEEMVLADNPMEWTHASFYDPFHAEHGRPNTPFSGYDRVVLPSTYPSGLLGQGVWTDWVIVSLLAGAALGGLFSLWLHRKRGSSDTRKPLETMKAAKGD